MKSIVTCNELLSRIRRLSFGCEQLDFLTKGGLPFCPITEITGEAGVGKTQLLLTLALTCQLTNNLSSKHRCIYISTEGRIPVERLVSFIKERQHIFPNQDIDEILSNILVDDTIIDAETLWMTLQERVPILLKTGFFKLVIIDSITSLFRGEFMNTLLTDRNDWFFGLSTIMKKLSDEYNCMFIISNQVSIDINNGGIIKPSLGLIWSHCINQRIFLKFEQEQDDKKEKRRILFVEFSPDIPTGIVSRNCYVNKKGFVCL